MFAMMKNDFPRFVAKIGEGWEGWGGVKVEKGQRKAQIISQMTT